jgi:hypothetical protein
MKLYELQIEDNMDEVFAISLVENPAIESDFIYFDKEVISFASVSDEKRIVLGPILIPDKKILRVDAENEPYEVYFTKDTVAKLAQNYLMKKYQDQATLEHDSSIKGVTLVESWVKESKINDKSNMYGLNLPLGTWVGMFKITDDGIWNDYVKTGKVKGFSIEGMFSHKLIKASANSNDDFLMSVIKDILLGDVELSTISEVEAAKILSKIKHLIKQDNRFRKGQRIDVQNMEGEPSIPGSSYAGQFGPGKKKKGTYIHPALLGTKK